jgi:hypothetical protein
MTAGLLIVIVPLAGIVAAIYLAIVLTRRNRDRQ